MCANNLDVPRLPLKKMADAELWGWHSFFEQIRNFLIDTSRHVGTSSEQYALHVVERMEVCISNVRNLREHLSQPPQQFGLTESEAEVISRYHGELGELLLCVEAISMQWQEHSDRIGIETVVANNAYHVSAEPSGQGRTPSCNVTNWSIWPHYFLRGQTLLQC